MYLLTSLVPRPHPVFQCCMVKNGRAWYLNDVLDNDNFRAWVRMREGNLNTMSRTPRDNYITTKSTVLVQACTDS